MSVDVYQLADFLVEVYPNDYLHPTNHYSLSKKVPHRPLHPSPTPLIIQMQDTPARACITNRTVP